MAKRVQRGLGRGLSALLGDVAIEAPANDAAIEPAGKAPAQAAGTAPARKGTPTGEANGPRRRAAAPAAAGASAAPVAPAAAGAAGASIAPAAPVAAAAPVDEVRMLPIRLIDPNRDQPRRSFDEAALKELAQSIRAVGVIQPIIVKPEGGRYTIIAGERRYRASRLAELDEIPAIVRDWDAQKRLEAALIENLQRDDLNPMEEAAGVRRLMDEAGLTQEKVAERLGRSRPAVANLLRLLTLPESVQKLLIEGRLSAGHARALVTVGPTRQVQLANLTVQQGWSVRQLERICAQPVKPEIKKPRRVKDAQVSELEGMARELFGTRVRLDGNAESGRITLFYYNADDLQRIWDVIESARDGR